VTHARRVPGPRAAADVLAGESNATLWLNRRCDEVPDGPNDFVQVVVVRANAPLEYRESAGQYAP